MRFFKHGHLQLTPQVVSYPFLVLGELEYILGDVAAILVKDL
jgi:hypothetical protein